MHQLRNRGGQSGNDNAGHDGPHRIVLQASVSRDLLEGFMARLACELGHEPNENEIKAKGKALTLQAINDYISS